MIAEWLWNELKPYIKDAAKDKGKELQKKEKIRRIERAVDQCLSRLTDAGERDQIQAQVVLTMKASLTGESAPDAAAWENSLPRPLSRDGREAMGNAMGAVQDGLNQLLTSGELILRGDMKTILKTMPRGHVSGRNDMEISVIDELPREKAVFTRTSEFLKKWNEPLFLHRRGTPLRLRDVYVTPRYEYNGEVFHDLKGQLHSFIRNFRGCRAMVIAGNAGMGKSSLVAFLSQLYQSRGDLVVLKFKDILNASLTDYSGRLLLLDAFDEAEVGQDRNNYLATFLSRVREVDGLRVIITTRENCIDEARFSNRVKLFRLMPFNETQVQRFCDQFYAVETSRTRREIRTYSEAVCIPLILYMTLSLDIDVNETAGVCELYGRIFRVDGGIYDRLATLDDDGYARDVHPTARHKEQMDEIAQKIAFRLFETSGDSLWKAEYEEVVRSVSADRLDDFAIANYYDIGGGELRFVHKSIYEYYTTVYLSNQIEKSLSHDDFQKTIISLLSKGDLEEEILAFLIRQITENKSFEPSMLAERLFQTICDTSESGLSWVAQQPVEGGIEAEVSFFCNAVRFATRLPYDKEIRICEEQKALVNVLKCTNAMNVSLYCSLSKIYVERQYLDNLNIELSFRNSIFKKLKLIDVTVVEAYFNNVSFIGLELRNCTFSNVELVNIKCHHTEFFDLHSDDSIFESFEFYDTFFIKCNIIEFISGKLKNVYFLLSGFPVFENVEFESVYFCEQTLEGIDLDEVLSAEQIYNSFVVLNPEYTMICFKNIPPDNFIPMQEWLDKRRQGMPLPRSQEFIPLRQWLDRQNEESRDD